jgi:ATP-dependent RNA helicase SUPV3L1/SUV3
MSEGRISGLARGLSFRLIEAGGVVDRARVAIDVALLSQKERRAMRAEGVRFGAFSLYLPALLEQTARDFYAAFAYLEAPNWRPNRDRLTLLPQPQPSDRALAAFGLRAVGPFAVAVESLEALDARLREAPPVKSQGGAGVALPSDLAETLGWSIEALPRVLKGLGFTTVRRATEGEPALWRRRAAAKAPIASPKVETSSPFAALAEFKVVEPPKRRPARADAAAKPLPGARRRRRRKPRVTVA